MENGQTAEAKIEMLIGQTIVKFYGKEGEKEIVISLADGREFAMFHRQDCCETVQVEDICGDVEDLIGSPLVQAEESTNNKDPKGYRRDYPAEGCTWTFYRLATAKGAVTIRWLGESNGYYSESVDCAWRTE